jgi:hypothetical protein
MFILWAYNVWEQSVKKKKKKHHVLRELLAEQKLYSIKSSWTLGNIRWIESADVSETVSVFMIRILISVPPGRAVS